MDEKVKQDVYNEIEEQITMIQIIKDKLDEALGENTYPIELLVSVHNWVNKWLISKSINAERQQRYEKSSPKKVKIILKDGDKKTIEVKDQLKADGWHFDSNLTAWTKEMTMQEWKRIAGTEPYKFLFAKFEEA